MRPRPGEGRGQGSRDVQVPDREGDQSCDHDHEHERLDKRGGVVITVKELHHDPAIVPHRESVQEVLDLLDDTLHVPSSSPGEILGNDYYIKKIPLSQAKN